MLPGGVPRERSADRRPRLPRAGEGTAAVKDCEMDRPTILVRRLFPRVNRRPRRGLPPAVRPLEGRRLLTGGGQASATMTQTVTFPDLESQPNLATQGV